MSALLDGAAFPGTRADPRARDRGQGRLGEALEDSWQEYILQVQKNAQAMAGAFVERDTI